MRRIVAYCCFLKHFNPDPLFDDNYLIRLRANARYPELAAHQTVGHIPY